jgi:hypothetical protein
MMWCTLRSPCSHVRTAVPELARPPSRMATTTRVSRGAVVIRGRSRWPIPPEAVTGQRDVAAQVHQDPDPVAAAIREAARSAARALAVAPRSSRTPKGTRKRCRTGSNSTHSQPGAGRGPEPTGASRYLRSAKSGRSRGR